VVELEACEYPDSQKVMVHSRAGGANRLHKLFRAEDTVDYYDRENTIDPAHMPLKSPV
jgi:hypothetical protein